MKNIPAFAVRIYSNTPDVPILSDLLIEEENDAPSENYWCKVSQIVAEYLGWC